MQITEFSLRVMELLEERISEEYELINNSILKANDTIHIAISVRKRGGNLAKNIYLEQYYEKYKEGYEMDRIIDDILMEAVKDTEITNNEYVTKVLKSISDYEQIKEKITIRLINRDMNQKYLEDKIYKAYLDFAIVFQIIIVGPDTDMATICISKQMFEKWGVSLEELYTRALENSENLLPANIRGIEDVIMGMMDNMEQGASDLGIEESLSKMTTPLYVLTNISKNKGAATIMYNNVLKDFAISNLVEEVIIIPSSTEEVLLIPKKAELDISESMCKDMLLGVNDTIEADIILSNNIYVYSLNANELRIYSE